MEIGKVKDPIKYLGITGPVGPAGDKIEPPNYYIDGAKIQFNQVGVALLLLRSRPQLSEESPTHEAVAVLRMSPQMAAQLATLIGSALETLQAQMEEAEKAAEASKDAAP